MLFEFLSENFVLVYSLLVCRLLPLFSGFCVLLQYVPLLVRLVLLLLLSAVISTAHYKGVSFQLELIPLMVILELFVGSVFLFSINMAFGAVDTVGSAIDGHMGFSASTVINPLTSTNSTIYGNAVSFLFVCMLVLSGLHTDMVTIISESIRFIPLGGGFEISNEGYFLAHLSKIFVLALMIFIPVFSGMFIVDIVAGILAKTMPQMNVYFVVLPIKILLGTVLMMYSLRYSLSGFEVLINKVGEFSLGL